MSGVPYQRRERLETALKMADVHTAPHYIAWVAADPFSGGFKVVITLAPVSSGKPGSQTTTTWT
jgi:hypothetical protein